jgi:hypothetical protein
LSQPRSIVPKSTSSSSIFRSMAGDDRNQNPQVGTPVTKKQSNPTTPARQTTASTQTPSSRNTGGQGCSPRPRLNAGRPGQDIFLGNLSSNDHLGHVLSTLRARLRPEAPQEEQIVNPRRAVSQSHAHPPMTHESPPQQQQRRVTLNVLRPAGTSTTAAAAAASQQGEAGGGHNRWEKVTVRNAKCDICNNRNKSIIWRCRDCGYQICTPCETERDGSRQHNITRQWRRFVPQGIGNHQSPDGERASPYNQTVNSPHQQQKSTEQGRALSGGGQSQPPAGSTAPGVEQGIHGQSHLAGYHPIVQPQLINETVLSPVLPAGNFNAQQLPPSSPYFMQQYPRRTVSTPVYPYEPEDQGLSAQTTYSHREVPLGGTRVTSRPQKPQRNAGRGPLLPRENVPTQAANRALGAAQGLSELNLLRTEPQTDDVLSSLLVEAPDSPEHPILDDLEAWRENRQSINPEQEQVEAREYGLDLSKDRHRSWWYLVKFAEAEHQQLKKAEADARMNLGPQTPSVQPQRGHGPRPTNLASSPSQAQSGSDSVMIGTPVDVTPSSSTVSASQ